ncbi:baseplate hub + tail lysozyme [Synechococcus phage ACG-2014d]|jgi:hypothetical protein|uniref:Baseplate hub + tail lysozyme n=1 Tax=Synechococcus phage ACG-2014d TaxID=1493509 RepID=A0A0E3FEK5_9CAUD|nr:baseplate hub and tail lysozyme [Synechococcus phage ACG-2014d]YP_010355183.1 baseplate hub and tail lysozyme [Synechococcus phage ACG-2014d]AIX14625.1 baseplate hub + tail lysozyme [Synechococcus phage ACG-2014d]AIX14845.1 baseplate hub + tail lysozyme [Synechococcus phage ACG-2014d]AIX15272.1 baseplate hub + tail lysozyme [Synechococcus phage ACG-2014d]AIX15490.1 baseplate hub + tail lysozyme [Synechococcus phage ACG-2014d]AIX15919.1 baseplate hub + tail lysozyme [Synechococcus phage ACG
MSAYVDNIVGESSTDFLGKDGFVWWIGEVEDTKDPQYIGRVKCRVLGFYTGPEAGFQKDLQTKDLPWANVLQPTDQAGIDGVGKSSHSLRPGAIVMGFFLDGEEAQFPIVMGVLRISQAPGTSLEGKNSTFLFTNAPNREDINPVNKELGSSSADISKTQTNTNSNTVKTPGEPDTKITAKSPNSAAQKAPATASNQTKPTVRSSGTPAASGVGGPWKTLEVKLTQLVEDLVGAASSVVKSESGDFVDVFENKIVRMEEFTDKIQNFLSAVFSQIVSAFKEQLTVIAGQGLSAAGLISQFTGIPFVVLQIVQTIIEALLSQICTLDGLISDMLSDPMSVVTDLIDDIVSGAMDAASAAVAGVQDVINQVTCSIQNGLGFVKDILSLVKAATSVMEGFDTLKEVFETGKDIFTEATNVSKLDISSITGFINLIFTLFDFGGCNRKPGKRAQTSKQFFPFFGVTGCSADDLGGPPGGGKSYPSCGESGGGGGIIDSIFSDADPYLNAATSFINGAYNLQLSTPGREASITRMASGATITDVSIENQQHAKYKILSKQNKSLEDAAADAKNLNDSKSDAADPLLGTNVDIPGNFTADFKKDMCYTIGKDNIITIDGDYRLKVSGDMHLEVGGGFFLDCSGGPGPDETQTQKSTINFASDLSLDVKGHLQTQGIGNTVCGKGGTNAEIVAPQGNTKIDAQGYEINASEIKLTAANTITFIAPAEYHFINTLSGVIPKAKTGIFNTVSGPVDYVLTPAVSFDPIPRFSINTVGPFLVNCAAGGALFTVAAGAFAANVGAGAVTLNASAACSMTAGAAVNITAAAICKISAATILLN